MSAQNLIFNNVELLGYTHENSFFGEKSLNYSAKKIITLQGFVLDLQNFNGVLKIFNDVNSIRNLTKDFHNITINNENYGIGKITDLSFDNGNWVRTTKFNATIEVLAEVPLQNIFSSEFAGINLSNKKLNLLKSFSENFNLDFDNQNKILGGEHSIEIEYDANNKDINLIILAQNLATELLKTLPPSLTEGNYNTRTNYKSLNSENYNLVDGKCGFNKNFSYSTENTNKPYSLKITNTIQLNEEGIATATESCEIKAEYDQPSLYTNALQGLNDQMVGIFTRVNNFFQSYKSKFGISRNLNSHQINKAVQINKFTGVITYNISYDNDLKKENPNYLFEYVNTLDRDEKGVWTSSESGNIKGVGKNGSPEKYINAEAGWNFAKPGIIIRALSFYNSDAKDKIGGSLKQLSQNVSRKKYTGIITYNYSYTDDPTIKDGSDMNIKRVNVEKTDTGLMPIIKNFIIPNNTYTLVQNRNFLQQGTYTVKVNLDVGCINEVFNGYLYFNKAKSLAGTPNIVDARDLYLESITFNSDEIEQNISYQATYKYS